MAAGEGKQITVLIILAKTVGTCQVFFFSVLPLTAKIPVKIAECDLAILGDCLLDGIYIIVDGLVHAFNPSGNQHRTAHQLCVLFVALGAKLFNQFP